jgi:hypothetical protein
MKRIISLLFLCTLPPVVLADQAGYCPQNASSISVGMSETQVISACGHPNSRVSSNLQASVKIPVKQLIYDAVNKGALYPGMTGAFYDQWSLPSGNTDMHLVIDIIKDKVSSVKINGAEGKAMTICGGKSIQVGDDVAQVYSLCGSPSLINTSYINSPMPASTKPEVWIYQIDQYQPLMRLTFINGRLESIN